MRSFIRHTLIPAGALASILFGTSADACEPVPETVTYIVTPDEPTSVDLEITYQDNTDYEDDHPQYCEKIAQYAGTDPSGTRFYYFWYECYGVPINEVPRAPEYS